MVQKFKVKSKQEVIHVPSGTICQVLKRGKIKIPHVGWFKSITYFDSNHNMHTRFEEDFFNKFEKLPKNSKKPKDNK